MRQEGKSLCSISEGHDSSFEKINTSSSCVYSCNRQGTNFFKFPLAGESKKCYNAIKLGEGMPRNEEGKTDEIISDSRFRTGDMRGVRGAAGTNF